MANEYISMRNLQFTLHEVLEAVQLNQYEYFQDYDRESMDMALNAARQIGDSYLYPIYREMDKDKARYVDGEVQVHPGLKKAIMALAEGGWIGATDVYEANGQQMPYTLLNAALLTFYAANANAAAYAFLTTGAARLIRTFGSKALNDKFIPNMYAGHWQGTMALTEPQAGSSLSDLTTSAEPTESGHYLIKGQKIYISGGDHTAVDNVVHLLLARIKGAPAGTKGISLFVVPKKREENGAFIPNNVTTAGIYGKMGQKGYVAAHLMLGEQGECHGYLVGEPHKGLRYMFQMMNEARIGTGLLSTGTTSAAYYSSLQYANERPQGRHPDNKDLTQPPVLIIEHADVKRMLLYQKAVIEGSIALLLHCSYLSDLEHATEGQQKEDTTLLLELLTPIAKSYPSEWGTQAVSMAMQVLGGAGYTDDFPVEQYYRDIRINSIYEGTTTIHGMDLLGRKVMMHKGKALTLLMEEIKSVIKEASEDTNLAPYAAQLGTAAQRLHKTTMDLVQLAMGEGPRVFLADATIYLENFSLVVLGWQWLRQAVVAQRALTRAESEGDQHFYAGKLQTFKYYFEYELPKTTGLAEILTTKAKVTLQTKPEHLA
jgi:alkylation response protein AidB-like acyl-CoA dehydrogenase